MSDDDLRAAAERLRTNLFDPHGYIGDSKLSDLFTTAGTEVFDRALFDARALAAAYLAEHPADPRRYRCGCPIQPVTGKVYNFCREHHAVLVDVPTEVRG